MCSVTPELLRRGSAERLMISEDVCATINWFWPEAVAQTEACGRSATAR
jgi:hypothetical protein